ncbi:ThiF family adenylyltransferase [Allomesorhizobium camelthorni]|uniref:Ubiquitin-activating enzyme n=1 Tax=Allomesorhizobium camelthorni TaxID=475069 RepID=A0A6G4WM18_9HYPH|nr:ThiF family adenylyltransferase [Mesorhizobium camelthorni]NGO55811.1 ubiquitin-activating enzyme [Mesorhizobium camelthorni]
MPEKALSLRWREAALQLEARLRERTGQVPERLDRPTIDGCYPKRPYVGAWRVAVTFPDSVVRRIDVLATAAFPTVPVRTALVDHPEFMAWPHVESDGILCLLPNLAECDPDDPCAVAENLLNRSIRLIEELLEGSIIARDFQEEFLTYWAYKAQADGTRLFSLLTPAPPSRAVKVWRGEGLEVIGEDAKSLADWVRRRFGANVETTIHDAAFIWLGVPPLPPNYPETASDLRAWAVATGEDAVRALERAAIAEPDYLVAILGALGRGGAGLIGVKVPNPKNLWTHPGSAVEPLSKGFRSGRTPRPILLGRYFGASPVIRASVQRADADWVHGRGQDPRTARLLLSTVVLFGCGSVGGPIACGLAQAGVGRIVLVDPDTLSWPNVGRHPLGASSVGRNKGEALAERLQADFPHLQIEGRAGDVHGTLKNDNELLMKASLIVAATGNWSAENALNRWHVDQGRRRPVLYAWTEPHAVAGHAVAIAPEGGCFQCNIGRTGSPSFRVVTWADGEDANREEPACGAHYQPYGPVELGYVTAMVGDLALDCLLNPPSQSLNRVFATSPRRIHDLGGRWSNEWLAEQGDGGPGVRTVDRPWPRMACTACQTELVGG